MTENMDIANILSWYVEAGVDAIVGDVPVCCTSKKDEKTPEPIPLATASTATHFALKNANQICDNVKNMEELKLAIENFEGCALKSHATKTVFGDGNIHAKVMFIGEAPGADEDRAGIPFVGKCGQLLDKMLDAINLNRKDCFISNILPWRPPGNRTPTEGEIAICLPFVKKQIELVSPDILVMLGGSSADALLDTNEPISRLRGKWFNYSTIKGKNIAALTTFHPAYLLRNSSQKAKAWSDFLRLKKKLCDN